MLSKSDVMGLITMGEAIQVLRGAFAEFSRAAAAMPVRVVRGPTQSIWVVDQGDFLSTSLSQPSTRGKVFRIEPHQLSLINILQ